MKIINILNNSALIAQNEKKEEFVLIGKGISFQKHPNDYVDISKIEKQFRYDTKTAQELHELLCDIPEKYFEITCSIVRYAKKKLHKELNQSIYISLFDHINSAIERYQDHIELAFALTCEMKILYEKEYEIAEWALEFINMTLDIELPEDECGFITIHLINALSMEGSITNTKKVLRIAKDIAKIVKSCYTGDVEMHSMDFSRFMTHLKYFAIRYLNGQQIEEETNTVCFTFSEDIVKKCKPCLDEINKYLKESYGSAMRDDECKYITLHLCRLIHINN